MMRGLCTLCAPLLIAWGLTTLASSVSKGGHRYEAISRPKLARKSPGRQYRNLGYNGDLIGRKLAARAGMEGLHNRRGMNIGRHDDRTDRSFSSKTRRWQRLQSRRLLVDVRKDLIMAEFALKLADGRVGVENGAPFPNVPVPNYMSLYNDLSSVRNTVEKKARQLALILNPKELEHFFQRVNKALVDLESIANSDQEIPEQLSETESLSDSPPAGPLASVQSPPKVPATEAANVSATATATTNAAPPAPVAPNSKRPKRAITVAKSAKLQAREKHNNNNHKPSHTQVQATVEKTAVGGEIRETKEQLAKSEEEAAEEKGDGVRLIVREDGTVDWDGVIESGREVAQLGADLWRRLNAKGPGEEGGFAEREEALTRVNESPRVRAMYESLEVLKAETSRKEELGANPLELDMERVWAFLDHEIQQGTIMPESERLLVAEFGLLDINVEAMVNNAIDRRLNLTKEWTEGDVDDDEIKVLQSQVKSFKDRLGLSATPLINVDLRSVSKFAKDTALKLKMAIGFYGLGTKLLGNDVQYALWLIAKAFNGDTLKPREARMLQRTAKDVSTLIPFTIILLIPLTPVGHVLVFSAIQKYFPNFYPSPYTERRQNLVRLYQEIEQKLDNNLDNQEELQEPGS